MHVWLAIVSESVSFFNRFPLMNYHWDLIDVVLIIGVSRLYLFVQPTFTSV